MTNTMALGETPTAEIKTPPTERPHHPYSPSQLQSMEVCPCYEGHSNSVHERCIAGTLAHKVVETREDDETLGDFDAAAAAGCMDFVDQRRRMMQEECDRANEALAKLGVKTPHQIIAGKEIYLPIDDCVFNDCKSTTAGYVDEWSINYNRTYAEMFDWKFGFWPVEQADNNLQAFAYALGLFRMYPSLQRIRFFFKQPHLEVVSDAVFTRDMVAGMYLRIQVVVAKARKARTLADFSMAQPHVPVCNFCRHIAACPKVTAIALKVGQKFHPVGIPADITPEKLLDPKSTQLALELAQVVTVWAKAFKSRVTDRVLQGNMECPPGQRLQQMPGRRKVVDVPIFKTVALRFVPSEIYDSATDVTFGPIEEYIQKKAPRGQKEATVLEFQKELEAKGAVVRGDGYTFLRAISEDKKDK